MPARSYNRSMFYVVGTPATSRVPFKIEHIIVTLMLAYRHVTLLSPVRYRLPLDSGAGNRVPSARASRVDGQDPG